MAFATLLELRRLRIRLMALADDSRFGGNQPAIQRQAASNASHDASPFCRRARCRPPESGRFRRRLCTRPGRRTAREARREQTRPGERVSHKQSGLVPTHNRAHRIGELWRCGYHMCYSIAKVRAAASHRPSTVGTGSQTISGASALRDTLSPKQERARVRGSDDRARGALNR